MIMNAKARQISVWDTVDIAVRIAVHTDDPKACRHAMRLLVEELGDDVPLRQAFLHALISHAEVGSRRGVGRVLAYEHAAHAYLGMRTDSKARQCDVDLLMVASKSGPGRRDRIEEVLRYGEGIGAEKLAMLFVLAADYAGEDARVKFFRLQGGDSYRLPGSVYEDEKRDIRIGGMFAPVHILEAAKQVSPAYMEAYAASTTALFTGGLQRRA